MGPDYWLFLYFLATIPVFLGLALVAQLGRSARARLSRNDLYKVTGDTPIRLGQPDLAPAYR